MPILSANLNDALPRSHNQLLLFEIAMFPEKSLELAYKVRNKLLYVESMIRVAGKWGRVVFGKVASRLESTPVLMKCASKHHVQILLKCAEVDLKLAKLHYKGDPYATSRNDIVRDRVQFHKHLWSEYSRKDPSQMYSFAFYYRNLYHDDLISTIEHLKPTPAPESISKVREDIKSILSDVLHSDLVLTAFPQFFESGQGSNHDKLFCAEVKDEDIPWDLTAIDW
jgi:hypothetical protein